MSGRYRGGIIAGSTSVSLPVALESQTTGAPSTGLAYSAVTAYYARQGGAVTMITLSALASFGAAYSSGGWFEADAVHMPGIYRLDVPDAAFAAGADWVEVTVFAAGTQVFAQRLALDTEVIQSGDVYALLNTAVETMAAGGLGTLNYTGIMRLLVALAIGLANGGGTGMVNLRDQANSKNRVSYTVDQNGNRTQMVVDLT
jgi:hypothetical protein